MVKVCGRKMLMLGGQEAKRVKKGLKFPFHGDMPTGPHYSHEAPAPEDGNTSQSHIGW